MKKYLFAVACLLAIVLLIGGIKAGQLYKLAQPSTQAPPATVVTAMVAQQQLWPQTLRSVGTLEAVQGVMVSADVPGHVTEIFFQAGRQVQSGDILVRQDIRSEQAQLRAAQADVALAKAQLSRVAQLLKSQVSSVAEYDTATANYDSALAQADNIRSLIDKKSIRAPFAGRLGIRQVNLGSDLDAGSPIVSLQAVDPIFVNFSLPQRQLSQLNVGLSVQVTTDAAPLRQFTGSITAINPEIDTATRNIRVQATLENSETLLLPGMYVKVVVTLPDQDAVLAVPATAVHHATFGDSVFVITEEAAAPGQEERLVAHQQFVRLGRALGDFVTIEKGLTPGDRVVTTGVFKLRNGVSVQINNDTQPTFSLTPGLKDS